MILVEYDLLKGRFDFKQKVSSREAAVLKYEIQQLPFFVHFRTLKNFQGAISKRKDRGCGNVEVFVGFRILFHADVDVILFFFVLFQFLVVDVLSNSALDENVHKPIQIGLELVVFFLKLADGFFVELILALIDLFEFGNNRVNFPLRHFHFPEHLLYRFQHFRFRYPDSSTPALEVRTAVINIPTLFHFGGNRTPALFAMYHSAKCKRFGGVFDRFLLETGKDVLHLVKELSRDNMSVFVGIFSTVGSHGADIELVFENFVDHAWGNMLVISASQSEFDHLF